MNTQPEALRIAKELEMAFGNNQTSDELRRLHEANQELLEALKRLVGTPDDPNNGWRGTGGTSILFACEYCKAIHLDCTQVPHADDCPILQARAAIAKHGAQK